MCNTLLMDNTYKPVTISSQLSCIKSIGSCNCGHEQYFVKINFMIFIFQNLRIARSVAPPLSEQNWRIKSQTIHDNLYYIYYRKTCFLSQALSIYSRYFKSIKRPIKLQVTHHINFVVFNSKGVPSWYYKNSLTKPFINLHKCFTIMN